MNRNNEMYKLFKTMKQGYAENNMDTVAQCARCWLQLNPENPFNSDTPEFELFFQMQRSFNIWMRGDIDRKINGRKMINYAIALCELNPRQPYKFDKQAEEEEQRIAKEAEEKRVEKAIAIDKPAKEEPEKEYVFGVVPDEKKSWLSFLRPWERKR